ncbi:MAG: hypothetical protein ACXWQQ_05345 [Pseudobdellovibrio sp.]
MIGINLKTNNNILVPLRYLFLVLTFLTLVGCATQQGVFIEESNYSVKQHRIAITSAFGLAREVSQNGRVVLSMYHDKNFKNIEVTTKTKERYFTRATILGNMRPYRVSVEVILERRDPDTRQWGVVEGDERLAILRAKAIKDNLNLSRAESVTFDEENPF